MIPQKCILKLRTELVGPLLESGDPGYDQSVIIDNGRIAAATRAMLEAISKVTLRAYQAHSSTRKEGKTHG